MEDSPNCFENRSSRGTRGLGSRWYLDPSCFQFEQEKLFQHNWIPIGYESQLKQTGDFFRFTLNEIDCIAVRDTSNVSRAFQNLCRHRGTQLCTDPQGHANSAMACPYHGWKYDFEGCLIVAPNMQDVDGFDKEEFGLVEYPIKSWNGLLFVSLDNTAELPVTKLDPIAQLYGLAQYQREETLSYDIEANWKLFFQNYNECYHCPSVHPQLTPFSNYRESENEFEHGEVLGGPMKIRDKVETISEDGLACGAIPAGLPKTELKKARYFSIFPNLFLSFFPDYVMVHRLTPISKSRTRIECDLLFHP
ncbi:MAG: aromatic ring-hydroxylating dioxygenase subunit alpha, partial [Planctomycetota bacterium]|nr:aromatic ring-hydroxylating dioxygenase subunit alpha [Planctomycetota bacterium]